MIILHYVEVYNTVLWCDAAEQECGVRYARGMLPWLAWPSNKNEHGEQGYTHPLAAEQMRMHLAFRGLHFRKKRKEKGIDKVFFLSKEGSKGSSYVSISRKYISRFAGSEEREGGEEKRQIKSRERQKLEWRDLLFILPKRI